MREHQGRAGGALEEGGTGSRVGNEWDMVGETATPWGASLQGCICALSQRSLILRLLHLITLIPSPGFQRSDPHSGRGGAAAAPGLLVFNAASQTGAKGAWRQHSPQGLL